MSHGVNCSRSFTSILVGVVLAIAPVAVSAADEAPDCTDQLQEIPRDGATIGVANPWLTYSGNLAYSSVGNATGDDVEIEGADSFEVELLEADSHFGVRLDELEPGTVGWSVADQSAEFSVDSTAGVDDSAPTIGEGEVQVELSLEVYEEFPVMFRQWELTFPGAEDDLTDAQNMRYLVEFVPEGVDEPSDSILVTPAVEAVGADEINIELGGRTEGCRHGEPGVPVTDEATVKVWAVDLAGNLSEQPAEGIFEGIPAEKLAEAHEELNRIVAHVEAQSDDEEAQTTEEIVAQMEEDDEESEEADGEGCSVVGGGVSIWGVVVLLGLVGIRAFSGLRRGPSASA